MLTVLPGTHVVEAGLVFASVAAGDESNMGVASDLAVTSVAPIHHGNHLDVKVVTSREPHKLDGFRSDKLLCDVSLTGTA